MAKNWKEEIPRIEYEARQDFPYSNHMDTFLCGGWNPPRPTRSKLIPQWVYYVRVCGFTFEFYSVADIRTCREHFARKVEPSSARPHDGLEHYWQSWWERLPLWIKAESKRTKVVKALDQAIEEFDD